MEAKQTPRIDLYIPGDTTKAALLIKLLEEYGMKPYPWQKLVLERWLAEDEDGNFVNPTCGLSVARQNGKGFLFVARIIYGIIFRQAIGLYTAQQISTADIIKKRVQDFFYENQHEEIFNLLTPRFRKKPRNYDYIEFMNGAFYRFATRSRMGGLGSTNDEVLNDEAADMLDSHEATLRPTVSAARTGNPQFIYAGTPPMAETMGTVFARTRKNLLAGEKGCWTEWSVETLTDPSDRKAWYATNPSLGRSLLEKAVEAEKASMGIDGFNRMRLGWWAGVESKRAISQGSWDKCYTKEPIFDDSFAPIYAVKFSPDRSTYSIAVAQPLMNVKKIHIEIVMHRPMSDGFQKLVKWFTEPPKGQTVPRWRQASKIIIDGATGQDILFEDLTSAGVAAKKIIRPNVREVAAAHEFTFSAIKDQRLSHYNQPALNQAVRLAKIRPIGRNGAFGWESMNKEFSTSALDAATFAFWGAQTMPKQRKTTAEQEEYQEKLRKVLAQL